MKTEPSEPTLVVKYDVSEANIAEMREKFRGVTFDTSANYEVGRQAIATCRTLRVAVEKRRKDLKADSLAFGRRVDEAAKHWTKLIEEVEGPMLAAKALVDEADAKAKRDAERAELLALEEKMKVEREAAEAKARVEREAEEQRLKAGRERLDAEKARQEAANREIEAAQAAERARLAEASRVLEEQQAALRAQQAEAQRAEDARQDEIRKAQAAKAREVEKQAAADRALALRPDVEKVRAFAEELRAFADTAPELESEARQPIEWAKERLAFVAATLDKFQA
jgi:chromosome segregation ATPase